MGCGELIYKRSFDKDKNNAGVYCIIRRIKTFAILIIYLRGEMNTLMIGNAAKCQREEDRSLAQ